MFDSTSGLILFSSGVRDSRFVLDLYEFYTNY